MNTLIELYDSSTIQDAVDAIIFRQKEMIPVSRLRNRDEQERDTGAHLFYRTQFVIPGAESNLLPVEQCFFPFDVRITVQEVIVVVVPSRIG